MLVANLALRTGKTIHWDAATMTARDCPEAAPAVRRRTARAGELRAEARADHGNRPATTPRLRPGVPLALPVRIPV